VSTLLEIDGLSKGFGGVQAVDDCSFSVPETTMTALIGPNGSGKTTVFNLVTGYLPRDGGAIRFAGRPIPRPDPIRLYRLGLTRTFQQARIFPMISVRDNMIVAIPQPARAFFRMRSTAVERNRADEVLDEFGLLRLAEAQACELSFGQRKLLEFATVLMSRPKLVLLDEPTSGVNPRMVQIMERHIRSLHADGLTFLIVEHDMNLVMRLCDPVIVLDHGAKIMEGRPQEVQVDRRVLDAYLGA
jgi:ABC-type branched-subunit amino acid transport system ATPase component